MRKIMTRTTVLAAVMAALLAGGMISAGCSSSDNDPPAGLYTVWQLQDFTLGDGTLVAVDDSTKYTIEFRTDGTVTVRADCNTCNGGFTADDERITLGALLACTLAACPPGSFDSQYLAALGTASEYDLTPQLLWDYEGGTMRFIPAPTLFE